MSWRGKKHLEFILVQSFNTGDTFQNSKYSICVVKYFYVYVARQPYNSLRMSCYHRNSNAFKPAH